MSRLALAAVLTLVLGAADPTDALKQEYEKFRGTWTFASVEADGKPIAAELFKDTKLTCDGDHFTYTEGKMVSHGTFKVNPKKNPKSIDVHFTDGPEKGETIRGIYDVSGDTYRACMAMEGKPRPTEFASKPGSGYVLEVLRRAKP